MIYIDTEWDPMCPKIAPEIRLLSGTMSWKMWNKWGKNGVQHAITIYPISWFYRAIYKESTLY